MTKAYVYAAMIFLLSCDTGNRNTGSSERDDTTDNSLTASDARFIVWVARKGLQGVQFGALASERASSQQVRKFAQLMTNYHDNMSDELRSIAEEREIKLPGNMQKGKQEQYEKLREMSGPAFDRMYMDIMVKSLREDIDQYKKMGMAGEDRELRSFAVKKGPVLRTYLEEARRIRDGLENASGNNIK